MINRRVVAVLLTFALLLLSCPMMEIRVMAAKNTGKNYTYHSADGKLSISLREVKENDYWYEYYIKVKNHSHQEIENWSIEVKCDDTAAFCQGVECTATANQKEGTVTISGMGTYEKVGAKATLSSDQSFKLGFRSSVKFKKGTITYNKKPASTGKHVGSGNTYLEGYSCNYKITGQRKNLPKEETPLGQHGALHVEGTQLKDEHGKNVILRGASTHGMHWGEMTPFVNKSAFWNLRDEWGVSMIRLVNYVTQGGYTQGAKNLLDDCIEKGVSYADELGLYAIIDWHIHAENPKDTKAEAIQFFDTYSKKYASHKNILYEICNEPTNTPWPQIKEYAEEIIKTIRKNDSDAIIIVGTNTWSQDVDEVDTNGGKIQDKNTMYTIHFYSGTHGQGLRDKVQKAWNDGIPIFCTEFGICDASGNGNFNVQEADAWIDFFEEKGISYCCWSLSNKDESASFLSPQCSKKDGWTNEDLGATGAWLINTYRGRAGEKAVEETQESPMATEEPNSTDSPQENTTSIVLMENGKANESYTVTDMSWLLNAKEEDKISVTYTCENPNNTGWRIMHWGATVDGTWRESSIQYMASTTASETVTKVYTIKEFLGSFGTNNVNDIKNLMLVAYNEAKILRLEYIPATQAEETAPPTGKIECKESFWEKLFSIITFGWYQPSGTKVVITAEGEDVAISYFMEAVDEDELIKMLTAEELAQKTFTPYGGEFTLEDENVLVYAKLQDKYGRITYISSNGVAIN